MYRIQDPVRGDDPQYFEDGVLDAEPITDQVSSAVHCRILSLHRHDCVIFLLYHRTSFPLQFCISKLGQNV